MSERNTTPPPTKRRQKSLSPPPAPKPAEKVDVETLVRNLEAGNLESGSVLMDIASQSVPGLQVRVKDIARLGHFRSALKYLDIAEKHLEEEHEQQTERNRGENWTAAPRLKKTMYSPEFLESLLRIVAQTKGAIAGLQFLNDLPKKIEFNTNSIVEGAYFARDIKFIQVGILLNANEMRGDWMNYLAMACVRNQIPIKDALRVFPKHQYPFKSTFVKEDAKAAFYLLKQQLKNPSPEQAMLALKILRHAGLDKEEYFVTRPWKQSLLTLERVIEETRANATAQKDSIHPALNLALNIYHKKIPEGPRDNN
jgi:hypothetical protein